MKSVKLLVQYCSKFVAVTSSSTDLIILDTSINNHFHGGCQDLFTAIKESEVILKISSAIVEGHSSGNRVKTLLPSLKTLGHNMKRTQGNSP